MSEIKVVPCPDMPSMFSVLLDGQRFVGDLEDESIWCGTEAEALAKKAELEAIENFVAEPMLAESPYICDNPLCEHPQGKHSALRCHVEDCSCMYFATSRPAASLPVQTRPPAPRPVNHPSDCATYKGQDCDCYEKARAVEQAPRPRRMTGQQLAYEFLMLPYYRQVKIVTTMLPGFKKDPDVQSDADFFKDCFAAIKDANRLPELEDALEAEGVKVPAAASSPVVRTPKCPDCEGTGFINEVSEVGGHEDSYPCEKCNPPLKYKYPDIDDYPRLMVPAEPVVRTQPTPDGCICHRCTGDTKSCPFACCAAPVAVEPRRTRDFSEIAERIANKLQPLLTDKYSNSEKIAYGIIEQELRADSQRTEGAEK